MLTHYFSLYSFKTVEAGLSLKSFNWEQCCSTLELCFFFFLRLVSYIVQRSGGLEITAAFVSAHNSCSLFLVSVSVNQSSDKERATAAEAHTPGAKMSDSARLSPPLLPLLWLQPSSPLSKSTPVCLRGAGKMKGNMQCSAFDSELRTVIRGKFTGLVCILNTL